MRNLRDLKLVSQAYSGIRCFLLLVSIPHDSMIVAFVIIVIIRCYVLLLLTVIFSIIEQL